MTIISNCGRAGRKKQGNGTPAASPAAPAGGAGGAGAAGAVGGAPKHKCGRKQRPAAPHSDHHLPPPPDILDDHVSDHTIS